MLVRLLILLGVGFILAGCQTMSDPTRMTMTRFQIEEPGKLENQARLNQHYSIGGALKKVFKEHGIVFEKGKRTVGTGYIHDNYPVTSPSGTKLVFVVSSTFDGFFKPKHNLIGAPAIGAKLLPADKELIEVVIAQTLANFDHVKEL